MKRTTKTVTAEIRSRLDELDDALVQDPGTEQSEGQRTPPDFAFPMVVLKGDETKSPPITMVGAELADWVFTKGAKGEGPFKVDVLVGEFESASKMKDKA